MIRQTFDPSTTLTRALLWRTEDAPKLRSLVEQKQEWYNNFHTQFWNSWHVGVFDLRTCNWFGCNVWAIILGLPQEIVGFPNEKTPWGFGNGRQNYDNGNFAPVAIQIQLTLEEVRQVLRMRYYALISNATIPFLNTALKDVFGAQGLAWVKDNQDMTIEYVFEFALSSDMKYVLDTYDILPRPAGVSRPPLV